MSDLNATKPDRKHPDVSSSTAEDVISPSANYRESTGEESCSTCTYFDEGICAVWNVKVSSTGICDSYEPIDNNDGDQGNGVDMSELNELYCSDGPVNENDDLVWKTVLRTGSWRYRPGPGQKPIPKPLHVIDGHSDDPRNTIGMADVIKSFNDKAIEHVTIPLSHNDKVDENTGYVEQLKIESDPDRPGEKVLRAGLKFTEADIGQKVKNKSIANTSCGLFYDYVRKDDGTKFPIALKHIALTNSPWINGMRPFGLSEEENKEVDVKGYEFDIPSNKDDNNVTVNVTVNVPPQKTDGEHFSEGNPRNPKKEVNMPLPKELEGLDLAEDAAAKVLELLQAKEEEVRTAREEATNLSEEKRRSEVEKRVEELKGLGLSEQPGFLKICRQVLLSDTGDNSLSLSEDGKEESITFSDVVNRLIDALPKKDGKISFGGQAESLGLSEDGKPAANAEGENKTAEEKYVEAHEHLYGHKPKTK